MMLLRNPNHATARPRAYVKSGNLPRPMATTFHVRDARCCRCFYGSVKRFIRHRKKASPRHRTNALYATVEAPRLRPVRSKRKSNPKKYLPYEVALKRASRESAGRPAGKSSQESGSEIHGWNRDWVGQQVDIPPRPKAARKACGHPLGRTLSPAGRHSGGAYGGTGPRARQRIERIRGGRRR
jgi:hypothetical protein